MKKALVLSLVLCTPFVHTQVESRHHDHDRNKTILGAVAVGCVIVKPSIALLPFKILLLPFKLIAALGTVALLLVPTTIAAGIWLAYPHWKKHKAEIIAHWNAHKHNIKEQLTSLTNRSKQALHHYRHAARIHQNRR